MSLSTSNAFAALDTKKKKKSKSKEDGGDKKKKQQPAKAEDVSADLEKAIFSQAKINVSNWADTDDDDDDFGDGLDLQDQWTQVAGAVYIYILGSCIAPVRLLIYTVSGSTTERYRLVCDPGVHQISDRIGRHQIYLYRCL